MDFQQLVFTSLFIDYPLSDMCVALQHAVIPPDSVPRGAKAELLALMAMDHVRLKFLDDANETPVTDIVDALLDTLATKLERN